MIFGPLQNITRDLQGQNQLFISYITLAKGCYKHEKIQIIQLEQCRYDQKWICIYSVNPSVSNESLRNDCILFSLKYSGTFTETFFI